MANVVKTRDVFSELPDDVLVHILSYLPTQDSVRTMLLRHFGDLWTLVPKLEFESFNHDQDQAQRFMIFVHHVMVLHQAPLIHSFTLKFHHFHWHGSEKGLVDLIQTWVKCALHKEPKLVSLKFSRSLSIAFEDIQLLLKSLQNVEILTLGGLLLNDNVLPQNRWKAVTLKGTIITVPCITWISDLVRKSPILEELTIEMEDGSEIGWGSNERWPEPAPPYLAPHLRKVQIVAGKKYGEIAVLQLIQFVLLYAVVLEELVISLSYLGDAKRFIERIKEDLLFDISCFTKASSNIRITIKD